MGHSSLGRIGVSTTCGVKIAVLRIECLGANMILAMWHGDWTRQIAFGYP